MTTESSHAKDSSEKSNAQPIASTTEAMSSIDSFGASLREFVSSMDLKNQELAREVERRKGVELELKSKSKDLEQITLQLGTHRTQLKELEQKTELAEDAARRIQSDLDARTETLSASRRELAQTLDTVHGLETELGTLKAELVETKRAKSFFEESLRTIEHTLAAKSKEYELSRTTFLKTEASLNETQAKLKDTDSELSIAKTELQRQGEELKDVRWQLHEHRELVRVTSAELARKNDTHSELETRILELERNLRDRLETISAKESLLDHSQHQLEEREEMLQRVNKKVEEQAGLLRSIRDQFAALEERHARQTDELRKAEERELRKRQELEQKTVRFTDLSRQFEQQQSQSNTQLKESRELSEKLKEESKGRIEAQLECERSRSEIHNLKSQVAKLYQDLELAEDGRKTLEHGAGESKSELENLRFAHGDVSQKLILSEELLERTKLELDSQVLKARNLHAENSRLKEKEEALTMKFDRLRVNLSDAQHALTKQRESFEMLNSAYRQHPRVEQLEREVRELRQLLKKHGAPVEGGPANESEDGSQVKKVAQVKPLNPYR